MKLRAIQQLAENQRNLFLRMPGPLSCTPTLKRPGGRWLDVDPDLGQDAGLLAGVERVVDRLLDRRQQGLARIVEAEQVAVLGKELADRNIALAGRHRFGGRPPPRRPGRDHWSGVPRGHCRPVRRLSVPGRRPRTRGTLERVWLGFLAIRQPCERKLEKSGRAMPLARNGPRPPGLLRRRRAIVKLEKPCGHDGSKENRRRKEAGDRREGIPAHTDLPERGARSKIPIVTIITIRRPAARQSRPVAAGKTGIFSRNGIQRFTPTTGKSRKLILESASIRVSAGSAPSDYKAPAGRPHCGHPCPAPISRLPQRIPLRIFIRQACFTHFVAFAAPAADSSIRSTNDSASSVPSHSRIASSRRILVMNRTHLRAALIAAVADGRLLWHQPDTIRAEFPAGLFSNYYVGPPGHAGPALRQPAPTPPFVGHTWITYPPFRRTNTCTSTAASIIAANPDGGFTKAHIHWPA